MQNSGDCVLRNVVLGIAIGIVNFVAGRVEGAVLPDTDVLSAVERIFVHDFSVVLIILSSELAVHNPNPGSLRPKINLIQRRARGLEQRPTLIYTLITRKHSNFNFSFLLSLSSKICTCASDKAKNSQIPTRCPSSEPCKQYRDTISPFSTQIYGFRSKLD